MELVPLFFKSTLQEFFSEIFHTCNTQKIQGPGTVYYLQKSNHSTRSDGTICMQNMSA